MPGTYALAPFVAEAVPAAPAVPAASGKILRRGVAARTHRRHECAAAGGSEHAHRPARVTTMVMV